MANDSFDNARTDKEILQKMKALDHPPLSLLVKLGSIAVHAEELMSPGAHNFDVIALENVLKDPEVVQWLELMQKSALLPVKR